MAHVGQTVLLAHQEKRRRKLSQQFAFEIKAQVKPVAALHVQINTTNDVFEAVTKKENKKHF